MKLFHKLQYKKQEPFRDASLMIIVCEGKRREPDYFRYFDQLDSRLKIIVVPSRNGASAPKYLVDNANAATEHHIKDDGSYKLWFVLDTDRWVKQHVLEICKICEKNPSWDFALSNPCFEVWLFYHVNKNRPENVSAKCKDWKKLVNESISGGFDPNIHPGLIQAAIKHSEKHHTAQGYLPDCGSTQVFSLGKELFQIVKKKDLFR